MRDLTAPARLRFHDIGKRFGGVMALKDVTFDVPAAAVHAVCGENGAGKSTLMKILSGVITDYEGELIMDGSPITFTEPRDAELAGISIIHQELNLVPQLSCAANIFLGREHITSGVLLDDRSMANAAQQYFQRLGADVDPLRKVKDLRIGDQQLVEIAKALSLSADVLIMDEPTSALADAEVDRLIEVVESLKRDGVTIVYISHKMDEIFRLADHITVLRDGKHIQTRPRTQTSLEEVINLMVGREIAALDLPHPSAKPEVVLRVDHLSLPHRERPDAMQLNDVGFELHKGEILGVAGLLGAGRTELLECLFGVNSAGFTGEVQLNGKSVEPASPVEAVELGLAMVTEDRKNLGLFEALTVGRNVTVCHLEELADYFVLSGPKEVQSAQSMIERLDIQTDGIDAAISSLSGGNQQKCVIARWLLTSPQVLMLDEPTRGIDVGAKAEIYRLLRQLCDEGVGILMTSSELPELLSVCDRIMVLCEGRKTAEFDRTQATEQSILHAAMAFETV